MKNTFLAIATITVLGLASCKKDFTCICTTTGGSTTTTSTSHTITENYSDANSQCNEGDVQGGGIETDCELDRF